MVEGILTSRRLVCLALAMGFAACGPPASSAIAGPGAMVEADVEKGPTSPARPPAAIEQHPPNADDDYRQGVRYLTGDGVPKDVLKAAQLLVSAAERGHAEAQYLIGISHGLPWGAKYDPALSASWLERAAEQGHE
ncbi:MAG: tetratricopeptide repeat protein, partial [Alphaproteobacteria bacterium]